jgi:hypothetical protein
LQAQFSRARSGVAQFPWCRILGLPIFLSRAWTVYFRRRLERTALQDTLADLKDQIGVRKQSACADGIFELSYMAS